MFFWYEFWYEDFPYHDLFSIIVFHVIIQRRILSFPVISIYDIVLISSGLHLVLQHINTHVRIGISRCGNICMAHDGLQCQKRHPSSSHVGAERMSAHMRSDNRKFVLINRVEPLSGSPLCEECDFYYRVAFRSLNIVSFLLPESRILFAFNRRYIVCIRLCINCISQTRLFYHTNLKKICIRSHSSGRPYTFETVPV